MILNNCNTCGRKPEIRGHFDIFNRRNHQAICKCGKAIITLRGNTWTAEVAADMWNRANPQEEEVRRDYLNYLAACIAREGFRVELENGVVYLCPSWKITDENYKLVREVLNRNHEMHEFYKKRLKPGVKV